MSSFPYEANFDVLAFDSDRVRFSVFEVTNATARFHRSARECGDIACGSRHCPILSEPADPA